MIGKTLGHYQITEKLGEGGMGVVYKARDTHLDRFVAIKTLPPERVADPDRKRRFIQEAKAASALNHPNIITIHDIDQAEGIDYIAMEYVAGKTLDEWIPRKGMRLPLALKYAVQITDALARAHGEGIIHRDLKPSNVMVDEHGLAKLLDFGLAKLTEVAGPEAETVSARTGEGAIVGTAAYMSPEQAEGKRIDARSDIFSFGSMLYEMLTGQRAFRGDTRASTIASILREEPKPISQVAEGLPREVERIVKRCLRKDPEHRFHHMEDLRVALEELKEESDSGALESAVVSKPKRRLMFLWGFAAAVVLMILVLGMWLVRSRRGSPEAPLVAIPLTSYPGSESTPSFSPDGSQIAFSWDGVKEDNFDIYVKLIGAEPPLRLTTNPAPEVSPAWAPDGRWIAFMRSLPGGKAAVVLISPIGGPERILTEMYSNPGVEGPFLAWTPDSRWLAIVGADKSEEKMALFLRSVETGEQRKMSVLPAGCWGDSCPAFSPDGHILAFFRWATWSNSDLHLLDLSPDFKPVREPRRLTLGNWSAASPAWTADGKSLIFSAWPNLWRVDATGTGQPQRLASIGRDGAYPAISWRGNRLAYAQWVSDFNIYRIELPSPQGKANPPQKFIASTRNEGFPQFSPDGKKIAFLSDRSGNNEIWVCEADGTNPVQLTSLGGPGIGYTPRWSPDSRRLTFDANIEGHMEIYVVDAGGGSPKRLTSSTYSGNPSWSRDGRWILFDSLLPTPGICKVRAEGGPVVLVAEKGGWGPVESPDGKFIYSFGGSADGATLLRTPTEGGDAQQVLGSLVDFEVVDNGIYFIARPDTATGYSIRFLDNATGRIRKVAELGTPRAVFNLSVSPDRRWALYAQQDQAGSDLMLVENFR